jgi:hypothetical protein
MGDSAINEAFMGFMDEGVCVPLRRSYTAFSALFAVQP